MPVEGMNHFTVLTGDLEACKRFYMDLLGLQEGFRPDLGFPGAWLYPPGGKQAVLGGNCRTTRTACSIIWHSRPRTCPAPWPS